MAARLLLLLCVGAVLCGAGAGDAYAGLSGSYRSSVDLALEQLNSHSVVVHHFRYLRSLEQKTTEAGFGVSYHYHHFYLKPTRCPKGTVEPNPGSCAFRNDRPLMDCVVCYKTIQDVIEASPSPYAHCIQKPRLTQDMRSTRTDHCTKMTYHSGAPTLLAVRTK